MKIIEDITLNDSGLCLSLAVDLNDVEEIFEWRFVGDADITEADINQMTRLISKMKKIYRTKVLP